MLRSPVRAPTSTAPQGLVLPPRADDAHRWLAVLRVVVGLWFLKSLFTKVEWYRLAGAVPVPGASERWIGFLPRRLGEWAEINPLGWYASFLTDFAIPNAALFAHLTTLGEIAVGVGLTLGLFTGLASVGGLFLMLNYLVASAGVDLNQQGAHVLLITSLVVFLGAGAGRVWGLDGLRIRRPGRGAGTPAAG